MKFIIKPRQTGKTTELIKMSETSKAPIITANKIRADHTKRQAFKLSIKIPDPMTITQILNKRHYGKAIQAFLIDDIENILSPLIGGIPILAITGTQLPGEPGSTKEDATEFKALPSWLQKLWALDPALAREAEADLGYSHQTERFLDRVKRKSLTNNNLNIPDFAKIEEEKKRETFYNPDLGKPYDDNNKKEDK